MMGMMDWQKLQSKADYRWLQKCQVMNRHLAQASSYNQFATKTKLKNQLFTKLNQYDI